MTLYLHENDNSKPGMVEEHSTEIMVWLLGAPYRLLLWLCRMGVLSAYMVVRQWRSQAGPGHTHWGTCPSNPCAPPTVVSHGQTFHSAIVWERDYTNRRRACKSSAPKVPLTCHLYLILCSWDTSRFMYC